MKALSFISVLSLAFLFSCKKDNKNTASSNLRLELVAQKVVQANGDVSSVDTLLAVLDVKTYNSKTGEITFNNNLPNTGKGWTLRRKVDVYNRDSALFALIYTNDVLSNSYNQPVLHHSSWDKREEGVAQEKDKWYILSGYPYGTLLGDQTIPDNEQFKGWKEEQLNNFQKIKSNWDTFVDELKKTGKYID